MQSQVMEHHTVFHLRKHVDSTNDVNYWWFAGSKKRLQPRNEVW